jgi:hypothetical protein
MTTNLESSLPAFRKTGSPVLIAITNRRTARSTSLRFSAPFTASNGPLSMPPRLRK